MKLPPILKRRSSGLSKGHFFLWKSNLFSKKKSCELVSTDTTNSCFFLLFFCKWFFLVNRFIFAVWMSLRDHIPWQKMWSSIYFYSIQIHTATAKGLKAMRVFNESKNFQPTRNPWCSRSHHCTDPGGCNFWPKFSKRLYSRVGTRVVTFNLFVGLQPIDLGRYFVLHVSHGQLYHGCFIRGGVFSLGPVLGRVELNDGPYTRFSEDELFEGIGEFEVGFEKCLE